MYIDRCVKLENKYITKDMYIEKTVYVCISNKTVHTCTLNMQQF